MKPLHLFSLFLLLVSSLLAEEAITIDVLSFNIRYGTAEDGPNSWIYRDELVFNILTDHGPDIVGLQEALKFQIDAIINNVPAYAMLGVGRENGDTLGEYSALLYKPSRFEVKESNTFWFSDTPDVIASKSWGNDIVRICTWAHFVNKETATSFFVFNLHLDHRSQPSRVQSTELLANRIAQQTSDLPVIVTGDFNAGEDNPAISFLINPDPPEALSHVLPLVDSFRLLHPEKKEVGTFNGFEGQKTGDKIDYIFVSSKIKVLEAAIIDDNVSGQYPSDHFPVKARLWF